MIFQELELCEESVLGYPMENINPWFNTLFNF